MRHLTKSRSANPKYRGGGSVSIIGAARSALMVVDAPQGDDPFEHVLAVNENNMGTAAPLRYRTVMDHGVIKIEWLGESPSSASDLLEGCGDRFESSQLDEACYVLYSILAEFEDPMSAKEVLKEATNALVSIRTLKRAKKRLGVKSYRKRGDDKDGEATWEWVWQLPADQTVLRLYQERALREQVRDLPEAPIVFSEPMKEPSAAESTMAPQESSDDPNGELTFDFAVRPWDGTDETNVPAESLPVGPGPSRSWDD